MKTSTRRQFLAQTFAAGGAVALPWFIPARALGKDGAVAPGEKIVLGGIGLGPRGQYDLSVMLSERTFNLSRSAMRRGAVASRSSAWWTGITATRIA